MNIRHLLHRIEQLETRVKQQDAEIARLRVLNRTRESWVGRARVMMGRIVAV